MVNLYQVRQHKNETTNVHDQYTRKISRAGSEGGLAGVSEVPQGGSGNILPSNVQTDGVTGVSGSLPAETNRTNPKISQKRIEKRHIK